MELSMRIEPRAATEVGLKVLCSPDNSEQTVISYLPGERKLQVDFRQSSLADDLQYWDYDPAARRHSIPPARCKPSPSGSPTAKPWSCACSSTAR